MEANIRIGIRSSTGAVDHEFELELESSYTVGAVLQYLEQNRQLRQPLPSIRVWKESQELPSGATMAEIFLQAPESNILHLEVAIPGTLPSPDQLPQEKKEQLRLKLPPLSNPQQSTSLKPTLDASLHQPHSQNNESKEKMCPSIWNSQKLSVSELESWKQSKKKSLAPGLGNMRDFIDMVQRKLGPIKVQLKSGNNPTHKKTSQGQRVIVREDNINFVPVPPKGKFTQHLDQDKAGLVSTLLDLMEIPTPNVQQIIFQSYEKSFSRVNLEESNRVEAQLQQKKSKFLPCSPVLMLGRALQSASNATVSYSMEETVASQFTMWHLITQFGEGWNKGTYRCEDDKEFSFDSISNDNDKLETFTKYFREDMAIKYGADPNDIIIQEIVRGSINVKFYYREGERDGKDRMCKSDKPHLKGRTLKQERLFSQFQLSEQNFDPAGDIDFVETYEAEEQVRGFFPYYQPAGCIRYGLNVKKYTEHDKNNSNWLSMSDAPGQWAVMFHGVGDPTAKSSNSASNSTVSTVKSIVETGLRPGARQLYKDGNGAIITNSHRQAFAYYNSSDAQKNDRIVGVGVYGSPFIQTALEYAGNFNIDASKESYMLVIQTRVRPDKIKITTQHDYWVVRETNFIRPYGLLIAHEDILDNKVYKTQMDKFSTSYQNWIAQFTKPSGVTP